MGRWTITVGAEPGCVFGPTSWDRMVGQMIPVTGLATGHAKLVTATVAGDGTSVDLTFESAHLDERPEQPFYFSRGRA